MDTHVSTATGPPKLIDLGELLEEGYLQEVNRQFFHPLGMALMVYVNEATGEVEFGGVIDNRDDEAGMIFAPDAFSAEKFNKVDDELTRRAAVRLKELGYVFQPRPK